MIIKLANAVMLLATLWASAAQAATPMVVAGLGDYSAALDVEGSVWTWTVSAYPAKVTGLPRIVSVASGRAHTLALGEDGNVWTWGSNSLGQLGNGSVNGSLTRVKVFLPTGVISIVAGDKHGLALQANGNVWVWGSNREGQLGTKVTEQYFYLDFSLVSRQISCSTSPIRLSELGLVADVSAGVIDSMAVQTDGTTWAWGGKSAGIGNVIISASPAYIMSSSASYLNLGLHTIAAAT